MTAAMVPNDKCHFHLILISQSSVAGIFSLFLVKMLRHGESFRAYERPHSRDGKLGFTSGLNWRFLSLVNPVSLSRVQMPFFVTGSSFVLFFNFYQRREGTPSPSETGPGLKNLFSNGIQ